MAENQSAFVGSSCMKLLQSYSNYRVSDWAQILPQCAQNKVHTGNTKQRCKNKAKSQEETTAYFKTPCGHFMFVLY